MSGNPGGSSGDPPRPRRPADLLISEDLPPGTRPGSGPIDAGPGPSSRLPRTAGPGEPIVVDTKLDLVSERVLGAGGMGVVYLVRDRALDRLAALKVLRGDGNPRRAARFRREARITARLDHPGVPPVFEVGRAASGDDYLLMRFVDGEPLSRRIAALVPASGAARYPGPDDPRVRALLDALVKTGEAVAYAHSRGVIHRDLKPDNVMLGAFGEVLVMDWGLARDLAAGPDDLVQESEDLVPDAVNDGLTREGQILGTPGFMPPEQAKGAGDADARADVWALGAMLVAALTGRPPVGGKTLVEVVARTLAGDLELPGPACPPALRAVAARALARDPGARYPSASAFVADVRAWLEGREVSVHRDDGWTRARRAVRAAPAPFAAVTAAVLLAPLVGAGVVLAPSWAEAAARDRTRDDARQAFEQAWARLDASAAPLDSAARTAQALQALTAAQRWSAVAPDDAPALGARGRAAGALGELALATGQWDLAREVAAWSDDPRARRAAVDRARTQDEKRRAAIAGFVLLRARTGSLRKEPEGLATGVFTLVREADAGVARLLIAEVEAAARELRGERARPGALDAARVSAEALGRLDLPGLREPAIAALIDYLRAETDELRAVPVGLTLVRLGGHDAIQAVLEARHGFGQSGPFARQVERALPGRAETVTSPGVGEVEDLLRRAADRRAQGDRAGAIEDLTAALARDPRSLRAWSDRAVMKLESGDPRAALADFDAALAVDPAQPQILANRAAARRALGDAPGALADLTTAVDLDPGNASVLCSRGSLLHKTGDLDGAIRDLTRALAADPRMAEAWHNRGRARQEQEDLRAAVADFDRALELDPARATTWSNRGLCRGRLGDLAGALADTTRAVEVDPRFAFGWYHRGVVRQNQGDVRGALEDYGQALALDPALLSARLLRGQARADVGDDAGAAQDLEEFLRRAPPGDTRRPEAAGRLERLKGPRR